MNSAKARLNLAVKRLGMTKKAVADAVGIPAASYLSAMFSDNPHFARGGEKYWQPLAEFLGVTVAWLRFGEGAGPGASPAPDWAEERPPAPQDRPAVPPTASSATALDAGQAILLEEMRSMKEMMAHCIESLQSENAELRERLARVEDKGPAPAASKRPSRKAGG